VEFRLLGPLEVSHEGRPVRLGGPKQRTVLAHLLLRPNQVVQADLVIDELWGDEPPEAARNVVQTYVSHLRKALGPERLGSRPGGYVLRAEPLEVDALRFEALVERAGDAGDPRAAARDYHEALALWRGPALADLADQPSLRPHITRLEELRMAAVEGRVEAELALGRHGELIGELERLVAEHPLSESLRAHLMVALYRSGRQAEALEAYRDARHALVEELGIEPGARLRALEQAILHQDPSLDLEEAPPDRGPPHNLPAQLTSFVGRDQEIAEVKELVARARLVTLTGPGGCGKTRLALQAASELLPSFRDGVFLVSVVALRDTSLVVPTIARTLGVQERPEEPVEATLAKHLATKELLLVLDNFEHLVEGAPDVTRLLEAAPGVKALVTSRELLRLSGEHEYAVPPLRLPDLAALPPPDVLAGLDSVALFVDRAQMADPRFRMAEESAPAVAETCLRLDGLPLSIELAASMVRTFEPPALLERLEDALSLAEGPRDVPARQRTLRDTIAWSYDLLPEVERRLFRALGIFLRGWSLEAAREVVDPEAALGIALEVGMGSLADKSLILRVPSGDGEQRWRMLETIREFARAELERASEMTDMARRHAEFFVRLAEEAEPHLLGGTEWLDRIERDHDNVRAALRWSIDAGQAELGMRMAGALWRFWHQHSHFLEGRRWLREVLSLPAAQRDTPHRFRALTGLGGLAYWQSDFDAADAAYQESLDLARRLADPRATATALYNRGYILTNAGAIDDAWRVLSEARDIHVQMGDRSGEGYADLGLGLTALKQQEWGKARGVFEESIALFRDLGDRWGVTQAQLAVARAYQELGDLGRAEESCREALTVLRELGDLSGVAGGLRVAAALRVRQGQAAEGVRIAGAAFALEEEVGGRVPTGLSPYEDARELAAGVLEPDEMLRAWEAGRSLSVAEAVALVLETDRPPTT
jgi:predicted ATPase/DNA-binding SARP family transcriptional activator